MPLRSSITILIGMLAGTCGSALVVDAQEMRAPVRDPLHIMRAYPRSYREIQRQNVVMQAREYSCGAAALATLTRYFWGDDTSEQMFLDAADKTLTQEEIKDRILNGLTLTDLRRAADRLGYDATIGTLTFAQLTEAKVPLVVGLNQRLGIQQKEFRHFVVYRGFDGYWIYLADPIRGNIRKPAEEFVTQWQKNAVLVVAKAEQDPPKVSPLSVRVDETYRGELNLLDVRKSLSRPTVMIPFPLFQHP